MRYGSMIAVALTALVTVGLFHGSPPVDAAPQPSAEQIRAAVAAAEQGAGPALRAPVR